MLGRCPQKAQCTLYALHTGCWSQPLACQGVTLILLPALLPFWSPEPHRCRVAPRACRSSADLTPCCLLEETLRKERAQILLPSVGLCSLTCPVPKTWHFW